MEKLNRNIIPLLILGVILVGIALRFLYMTADPPTDLTISGGILGDAGLYSYAARNMVLFHKTGFAGYEPISGSPFMTYVNYFVYKIFGINFYTHRIIPVLFSIFSLLFFSFIIYKYLGYYACLFASIFIAFNYPVLMFSRSANRQFPMLFFFLISLYFFIKGAENKKNIPFFFSALFFLISYLSKGTILFLVPLFFIVGLVWLIERRLKFKNLLTFVLSLSFFFLLWRFFIYLPYRHYLDSLISHNIAAGNIISLSGLIDNILHRPAKIIANILNTPFMLQFKSDPVLLVITLVSIFIYIYYRIKKKEDVPYILDIAVLWILIIVGKNAIFSYRPIRHYLDLVFPCALLSGWLLKKIKDSDIKIKINLAFALSLVLTLLMLFPFGILKYFNQFFKRIFLHHPIITLFYSLILLSILLILLFRKQKVFRVLLLIFVLIFSIYANLSFFHRWAKARTYQVVRISDVFGRAIPPSFVVGNWVSLLATGTPHRTTLAWPGQINWEPDFLPKNQIQYVMISDFSPDGYLAYRRMFKKELDDAALLAIFSLHKKNLYFFKLAKDPRPNRLEIETFYRDRLAAQVIYGEQLSNRMGVRLPPIPGNQQKYHLEREFKTGEAGPYEFTLRAKGNFLINIEIKSEVNAVFKKQLIIREEGLGIKTFQANLPEAENLKIKFIVQRLRNNALIDFIEFNRVTENPVLHTPVEVTDNLGNRREYRVFLPSGQVKSKNLPLLVYFHGVMSEEFKEKVPGLKNYTGSPIEETGLVELGNQKRFVLLVPTALYEFKSLKNCTAKGWDIDKEIDGVEKIIDKVVKEYKISEREIYLAGISAGAVLCHHLANRRPSFYSAILSHSQAYTGKDGKDRVLVPAVKGPQFGVLFAYNQGDYPNLIEFCRESYEIYQKFGYKTMLLKSLPPKGHAWSRQNNLRFWNLLQKLNRKNFGSKQNPSNNGHLTGESASSIIDFL